MKVSNPAARILVIGVPETPGRPPLSFTIKEVLVIAAGTAFRRSCSVLFGSDATIAVVKSTLPHHNWVHACCHGHCSARDPLDTAFHLVDGELTLFRIAQMRLETADFAFLSACHTERHFASTADESINLSSVLQVAGFRGTIGTLCGMGDGDGPYLAERFYHWLVLDGRAPEAKNAAEALHLVAIDLRRVGLPLYRWAAFVNNVI